MRGPPDAASVARALRRTSQLRALFHRLPHAGTPREQRALEEWREFRDGTRSELSLSSARIAVRRVWSTGSAAEVLEVLARLPPREARDADRTLATFEALARWALASSS